MVDVGLTYDPARGECDIAFARGDAVLDITPATPVLFSLLADRRALPTDALPDDPLPPAGAGVPVLTDRRRGWCGDALDPLGRRAGSRLWLLQRAKAGEQTRKLAETAAADALGWLRTERNLAVTVTVEWVRRQMLGIRVTAGTARVGIAQQVGA